MRGRGYTSCLLCDKKGSLILGDELIKKIIKHIFIDKDFDNMFEATRVCLRCIGRLQQVNDFYVFVKSECLKEPEENKDKKLCILCKSWFLEYGLVPQEGNHKVINEIAQSNLMSTLDIDQNEKICCFACYDLISAYNETKGMIESLNDYFYRTLTNCSVLLRDCSQEENALTAHKEKPTNSNRRVSFSVEFEKIEYSPIESSTETSSDESSSQVVPNSANVSDLFAEIINSKERTNDEIKLECIDYISSESTIVQEELPDATQIPSNPPQATDFYADLLVLYNILECAVHLERLNVKTVKDNNGTPRKRLANSRKMSNKENSSPKQQKISPKKQQPKATKIKLVTKSKAIVKRKPKRSLKSKKKQIKNIVTQKIHVPPVLVCESNSGESIPSGQSNENASDPLLTSQENAEEINAISEPSTIEAIPENEKNKNIKNKVRTSGPGTFRKRKTRSDGNLRETSSLTNIPDQSPPVKILKTTNDAQADQQISTETKDSEVISDTSTLSMNESTEIEFLHPKFKNKAVKFEHTSVYEELDLIFRSDTNDVPNNDLNDLELNNEEYLDESETLEDLLNMRPTQSQNDVNCPIYTMDELRNEDSLLNVT